MYKPTHDAVAPLHTPAKFENNAHPRPTMHVSLSSDLLLRDQEDLQENVAGVLWKCRRIVSVSQELVAVRGVVAEESEACQRSGGASTVWVCRRLEEETRPVSAVCVSEQESSRIGGKKVSEGCRVAVSVI